MACDALAGAVSVAGNNRRNRFRVAARLDSRSDGSPRFSDCEPSGTQDSSAMPVDRQDGAVAKGLLATDRKDRAGDVRCAPPHIAATALCLGENKRVACHPPYVAHHRCAGSTIQHDRYHFKPALSA